MVLELGKIKFREGHCSIRAHFAKPHQCPSLHGCCHHSLMSPCQMKPRGYIGMAVKLVQPKDTAAERPTLLTALWDFPALWGCQNSLQPPCFSLISPLYQIFPYFSFTRTRPHPRHGRKIKVSAHTSSECSCCIYQIFRLSL